MKKLFALIAGSLLLGAGMAYAAPAATVITFDDLPVNARVPTDYADLTWGARLTVPMPAMKAISM